MARYFQHLEKGGSKFLTVTELDYIDDSEPDFILYFFKDGTKCNQNMIGKINDMNAFGKMALVELSSPSNKWNIQIKQQVNEKKTERAKDGQIYEIANPYGDTIKQPRYEVISKPYIIKNEIEDDVTEQRPQSINFNNLVETHKNEQHIEDINDKAFPLDTDYLISKNKQIEFKYNGKKYSMPASDFFANAIKYPEEKIVKKEVIKEIKKEVSDEHIDINISNEQRTLVDNMINMSQKETCDIEMELTLTLPPISVYRLIKQVYPAGMAKGFVNIIADRMQIKELKMAVANGLLAYYDEDAIIEEVVVNNKQNIANENVPDSSLKEQNDNKNSSINKDTINEIDDSQNVKDIAYTPLEAQNSNDVAFNINEDMLKNNCDTLEINNLDEEFEQTLLDKRKKSK